MSFWLHNLACHWLSKLLNVSDHTEVRLTKGNSSFEGRIEVKYNGHWGNVCATEFGENDARVVCRMLGFETRYILLVLTTKRKVQT